MVTQTDYRDMTCCRAKAFAFSSPRYDPMVTDEAESFSGKKQCVLYLCVDASVTYSAVDTAERPLEPAGATLTCSPRLPSRTEERRKPR